MKYRVNVKVNSQGFTILLNKESHKTVYPQKVWDAFPESLRQSYAEFIGFITTVHYSIPSQNSVLYSFPIPLGESFFYEALIMSLSENWVDKEGKVKTSELLKQVLNSFYRTNFSGHASHIGKIEAYVPKKNNVLVPFSFGKDSLLTYALCKEIGLKPFPLFFIEPRNIEENKTKLKLRFQFEKEFNQPIETFTVPFFELKRGGKMSWGWDVLLTQYTLFLIPFMHYYKVEYFFWSNERNCSKTVSDSEGFTTSATFDQNARWLQTLNIPLRLFGVNAKLGSIIEPLTEIADFYVLQKRYPAIGKYQLTCQGEHKVKRWCGRCYDCAKFYLYMIAFGFDPHHIGIVDTMFLKSKYQRYKFFDSNNKDNFWRDNLPFYRNEKLLAFYLAYKKGAKGHAIDLFRDTYLKEATNKLQALKKTYLELSDSLTTPDELKDMVKQIFTEELKRMNI